jgi:hypothetical protein
VRLLHCRQRRRMLLSCLSQQAILLIPRRLRSRSGSCVALRQQSLRDNPHGQGHH